MSETAVRSPAREQGSDNRDVDAEEVEDLLFEIRRGDLFDYSLLLHLPVAVQNQTIAFMMPGQHLFEHPLYFAQLMAQHGARIIPDNLRFQRRLLRWFSTLHWGIAELLPVAPHGRKPNPITQRRVITT